MGVRGLSTYFSNRDLFFEQLNLSDTKVVIDGNNLRFALYKWCPGLNHCFGGDYDKYARYVEQFFRQLLACNVRPIVVFDGGYEKNNQKLATVLQRMTEQTKNAVVCNSVSQVKMQVFPLLGRHVFIEVLTLLDIETIQCSYEADQVIAQIARKENCPVISNDSDFFIFNVRFISLDSLEFDQVILDEEGRSSINCLEFNRAKLLDHYGILSPNLLALLASLLGNDYIPPHVFDKIFQNIKLPKKGKDATERHRKIKGLLLYLSKERCHKSALNKLLSFFQDKEREVLKIKVLDSIKIYTGEADCEVISPEFSSREGTQFPPWFTSDYHEARLPPWLLGIPATCKFFLSSQVEDKDRPSAHLSPLSVFQQIINLLATLDTQNSPVKLFARAKTSVALAHTFHPTPVVHLDSVRLMSCEQRQDMLMDALCPSPETRERLSSMSEDMQLVTMVLDLWCREEKVSLAMVTAVLLCNLVLTRIDPETGTVRSTKKLKGLVEEKEKEDGDDFEFYETAYKLSPHFHLEESMKTSTKKYDARLVHSLSVLQAIINAVLALNALLGNIMHFPKVGSLFNGTFIFNMTKYFSKNPYRENFLPNTLGLEFNKIVTGVTEALGDISVIPVPPSKKNKKQKRKGGVEDDSAMGESQRDIEDSSFQDAENKFAVLSID